MVGSKSDGGRRRPRPASASPSTPPAPAPSSSSDPSRTRRRPRSLEVGDTIIAVDGEPGRSLDADLAAAVGARRPGDAGDARRRGPTDGETREVTRHARRPGPTTPPPASSASPATPATSTPAPAFTVDIDSGRVGGPSAGLAFTLAILDVLTPGDLTGGPTIAVTGTIERRRHGRAGRRRGPEDGRRRRRRRRGAARPGRRGGRGRSATTTASRSIGVATLDEALAALERLGGDPLPARASPSAPG